MRAAERRLHTPTLALQVRHLLTGERNGLHFRAPHHHSHLFCRSELHVHHSIQGVTGATISLPIRAKKVLRASKSTVSGAWLSLNFPVF